MEKKYSNKVIAYAIIIVIAVLVVAGGIVVYSANTENKVSQNVSKIIPYPAAIINYTYIITVKEVDNNLSSIRSFYENQDFSEVGLRVDFSTDEGQKRLKIRGRELMDKMIEDKIIEIIARKNGVKITKEQVDQSVERKLDEYGTREEVRDRLSKLYGWTIDDFKEKIVRPSLYQEELEKFVKSQEGEKFAVLAKEKIEKAKADLDNREDFSEMVKNYSEGLSAVSDGELGWFKKDQLVSEVAEVAFSLDKGKGSGIIESEIGFHIIEVTDKKKENNEDLVEIRQIFVRKRIFTQWLEEQMNNMNIFIPLKEYYWDHEILRVQFKDDSLKEFEKDIIENFQGDASILF